MASLLAPGVVLLQQNEPLGHQREGIDSNQHSISAFSSSRLLFVLLLLLLKVHHCGR
jgi:hypothetical protein